MEKRMVALFASVLLCFSLLLTRLMAISTNTVYAQAAEKQSAFALSLEDGRGNFFDCRFRPLTGISYEAYALAAPTADTYRMLFDVVPPMQRTALYTNIQKSIPFLIPVTGEESPEYETFLKAKRYAALPIAPHLIGYCDENGRGITALEAACDSLLMESATQTSVICAVSARGDFIKNEAPRIVEHYGSGNGVMLTLDAALQRMCEGIAQKMMDKGSIVIMETATGRVRASVSMPLFDPDNPAKSIQNQDAAFMNRSISSFNVGSVYKPLLAAAALETGVSPEDTYECEGSIEVDGHVYRCAHSKVHGTVNMRDALAVSCNGYFVQLGQKLGGDAIVRYSHKMGFGESTVVYDGYKTARGSLPNAEQLQNTGALASVSFGQGMLMATPVQVASFMNTIANGGVYVSPSFVEGVVNEYAQEVTQSLYQPVTRRCMTEETAATLREMLIYVVDEGLGATAKPLWDGAGGKTGSAQTGRFNEAGEEIFDAWFAGFYPAQKPAYTVAVLLDSGTHSSEDACAIFAEVTSALHYFMQTSPAELLKWEEVNAGVSDLTMQKSMQKSAAVP